MLPGKRAPLLRLCAAAVPLALCALLLAVVYRRGSPFPCPFYTLTGLYCPGCGSGRALEALLHGRLGRALRENCMLVLLGPPAFGVLVYEYLRYVFPAAGARPLRLPLWAPRLLLALLVCFGVLRNLPFCAFLAP